MTPEKLIELSHKLQCALDSQLVAKIQDFLDALYEHNKSKNLTRVSRSEAISRHILDSLLVSPLIPRGARVLDIGCGPGFPAWPLALARPDLQIVGLDSNSKMLDFLRSQVLPNLSIVCGRAEEYRVSKLFDVVTGRAVAPLPIQAEISAPLVQVGGLFLPLRTKNDIGLIERLTETNLGIKLQRIFEPSTEFCLENRAIPIFKKTLPTPKSYPRRWSEIKKRPLLTEPS